MVNASEIVQHLRDGHLAAKISYGTKVGEQYFEFHVTGADILAGEAAMLAKVEAQLGAQLKTDEK